ncbi:hypothetical protein ABTK11_22410, partial [Acinetobacter baumannii]
SSIPGRTGSATRDNVDYDPQKSAVLTLDEWARVLCRHVVDVYHQSPHAGLMMETPADAWDRVAVLGDAFGIMAPPDRK